MGVIKLEIVFDQPDKVYNPGQTVTGKVELAVDSVIKIKGMECWSPYCIKLKFEGKGECKWIKSSVPGTREIYLKNERILAKGEGKYYSLSAGEHSYPFSVMLPMKIPSSFVGSYGGITYYGEVQIEIPYAPFDKKERSEFTVVNPLNLNFYSFLRTAFRKEEIKKFWFPYRTTSIDSSLSIVVNLSKIGFTPSETIPITLEVKNASNVTITGIYIYLIRNIEWKIGKRYIIKNESKKLHTMCLNGVAKRQCLTLNENFTIPSISFPSLIWCSIIKIYHKLYIKADISGIRSSLDMHIPITIGDIPLKENSIVSGTDPETSSSSAINKVEVEMSLQRISMNPLLPLQHYSKLRSNSIDPQELPSFVDGSISSDNSRFSVSSF